jgi:hypothetical protein
MATPDVEADLIYAATMFQVVRPGRWVTCSVTGARIPLGELRYWSVERQEAYATPEAALEGWRRAGTARNLASPAA